MAASPPTAAGWYPDPQQEGEVRWWDGSGFTADAHSPDGEDETERGGSTRRIGGVLLVVLGGVMLLGALVQLPASVSIGRLFVGIGAASLWAAAVVLGIVLWSTGPRRDSA